MKIRHFESSDIQDLSEIYSFASVTQHTTQLLYLPFEATKEIFSNPSDFILVAEEGGKVLGHVTLFLTSKPRAKHSASIAIAVHPDAQGQGIGRKLMTEVIKQADCWLNLVRLELEVYTDNVAAISLYKKLGFEIEGEKRCCLFKNGRFENMFIMSRLNLPSGGDVLF